MMRRLKIIVVFGFIAMAAGFKFWPSAKVSGQSGLAAPTGFSATENTYNNKVGLNWDTIRGATRYRIFRNTINDPATATDLGITQMAEFFDLGATAGQTFFYWVRAENAAASSPLSAASQGARALAAQQGPVPPLEPPPAPPANPATATKAYLGKALFWDEQMSSTQTVSCGTCHKAGTGGSDPRSLPNAFSTNPGDDLVFGNGDDVIGSRGVPKARTDGTYEWSDTFGYRDQVTGRKANSFINAAYSPLLFWDGRANGTYRDPITNAVVINAGGALENQSAGPPTNDVEMAHAGRNWNDVAAQLATAKPLALSPSMPPALEAWINGRSYPELFEEAFGTPDVTPARISLAIGSYERTLYSDRTPLDLANAGITPLQPAEQRGRNVFINIQCGVCHAGNQLTDNTFRNIGLRPVAEDGGRFDVTGNANNLGQFRVPGLRNAELRGSFMHNGRLTTLEDVVEFYNRGGDFRNEPNFAANLVQPRNLTAGQKADLLAFLRRPLTDQRVANSLPPFDRPVLYAESNRVPQITGTGKAGSGGAIPAPTAIEPPVAGNTNFTVAVSNGLGGANAVLVVDENDPGTGSVPASGSFARIATTLEGSGAGNGRVSLNLSIPNNAAIIGRTFFGRWYITDPGAAGGFSASPAFRFTVFGEATAAVRAKHADFDGDGKTDVSVFRPSDTNWYITQSSNNAVTTTGFGLSGDKIAPADFDGDGKTDIAIFRNGAWFVLKSSNSTTLGVNFGLAGDKPQPGDYDGDNLADMAVFRPSDSTWYLNRSRDGFAAIQFGVSSDRPVSADYDGDGKADIGIYRDGIWFISRSRDGLFAAQFGIAEDKPVLGDYDGDGKSDLAVWRPSAGTWYYLLSSNGGFSGVQFGVSSDVPSPGDYDGDGKADFAVFRQGGWHILRSSNAAYTFQQFGLGQDIPVPSALVP